MESLEGRVVGETRGDVVLETSGDNRTAAAALAAQARRTLLLFTRDLDPTVYDTPEFVEAVSRLARSGRLAWVRVLVQDTARVVKEGHRLVELARRLSSNIDIRRVAADWQNHNRAFLVVDDRALLLREHAARYDGIVNFHDPETARELARFYHRVWDHSQPDPELRHLHL